MAEYIERGELESVLNRIYGRLSGLRPDFYAGYMMAFSVMMKETRAADVAPVVHGRWIGVDSSYWKPTHSTDIPVFRKTYRCSECGRRTAIAENYCPNCGARMDADTQEREDA